MREMKDSGVEWLGNIPADWEITRIKNCFKLRNERNYETLENVNLISLYTDKGVVQHSDLTETTGNKAVTAAGYKMVYKRDIVVNIILCWMGAIGMSKYNGVTSPAYDVYKPFNGVISEYFHYLFRTSRFNGECYRYGRGIMMMRWRTYTTEFRAINIPLPPRDTQLAIVEYLDKKCSDVDVLIRNVLSQIEMLKVYKQSLITEVVTKGLDPSVPMKDSGVEWIGEVPSHWNVKRLKFAVVLKKNKWTDAFPDAKYVGLEHIESGSGKRIDTDSVYDRDQAIMFEPGNILFGKLRPYLAKVYICHEKGCCSSEFCVFEIGSELDIQYAWSVLISQGFIDQVNFSTYGTKMPRANADFILNMYIPVPPMNEQQAIAEFIHGKCARIDQLITLKQKKIDKLNEYKKSLIYEYVTGKKEVS